MIIRSSDMITVLVNDCHVAVSFCMSGRMNYNDVEIAAWYKRQRSVVGTTALKSSSPLKVSGQFPVAIGAGRLRHEEKLRWRGRDAGVPWTRM